MVTRRGPLQRVTDAVASQPFWYDLIQVAAGQHRIERELLRVIPLLMSWPALDIGSAGGRLGRRVLGNPFAIDLDLRPLIRARGGRVPVRVAAADAAVLPFAGAAFSVTLCACVSHHLEDTSFAAALAEIARVTRHAFVFVDAVRDDSRAISRLLWHYDRGSHPRPPERLVAAIEQHFVIHELRDFAFLHRYLLCVARPR
jgi:SAM-dependent methyltransferase